MEHIVSLYNLGKVTEDKAIDFVEKNAFGDVVPRFYTVNEEHWLQNEEKEQLWS